MARLPRQSLTDRTLIALRDAIFSGRYVPGQRLTEEELAERLGVSRVVVREALFQLSERGLAKGERNRGKAVADPGIDELAELIPLRLLMESLAATWAASRITPPKANMLKRRASKFLRKVENYSEYVTIDFEVHRTIWELAGNEPLAVTLERLACPMIGLAARLYSPVLDYLLKKEQEGHEGSHQKIVEAICRGEPTEARRAMQLHILTYWKLAVNRFSGARSIGPEIDEKINDVVGLVNSLAGVMDSDLS